MSTLRVEGEPLEAREALVVVLGTLPGDDSLRRREYYAKSTNTFWDIMGDLFGAWRTLAYAGRVAILKQRGLAVWDVLKSAFRDGSTDSGIVRGSEVPKDFNAFFRTHDAIRRIYFNGGAPEEYFRQLAAPGLVAGRRIPRRVLPSTSPSNTHMTKQAKIEYWREIQQDLVP
jgi:hypoxanthine-DNA glycosylase